jgi:phosphoglycolate phosphatase
MRPDALIFDMDGTLLNTLGDIRSAVNAVMELNGYPSRGMETFRRGVGWGVEHLVMSLVGEAGISEEDIPRISAEIRNRYENIEDPLTEPYDGICDMLDEIQLAGIPMAILTNKPQRAAELVAAEHFPGTIFHAVRGSLPGRPVKPGPEAALSLAGIMGSSPEGIMLVGDSEVDILTGRNAGMMTIGVEWGFRSRKELEAAGADIILRTPAEVLSYILRGG